MRQADSIMLRESSWHVKQLVVFPDQTADTLSYAINILSHRYMTYRILWSIYYYYYSIIITVLS